TQLVVEDNARHVWCGPTIGPVVGECSSVGLDEKSRRSPCICVPAIVVDYFRLHKGAIRPGEGRQIGPVRPTPPIAHIDFTNLSRVAGTVLAGSCVVGDSDLPG